MTKKTDEKNPMAPPAGVPGRSPDVLLQMLPIIFHKLKNKLTPILGYAQILRAGAESEFQSTRLQKIETGALDFTELLNRLKDYFQTDPMPMQPASLSGLVAALEPQLQELCRAAGVELQLGLSEALPERPFAAGEIRALLLEMADNAIDALAKSGRPKKTLRIATRAADGVAILTVRDDGVGLTPEEQDRIWAPFYTTREPRAGLGLVLCEKIIANHGAACTVSSSPGEFCEFAIAFPIPEPA